LLIMDSSKQVDARKERIIEWFKRKENLLLLGVIIFALAIRIYYFLQTLDQPLWWDEAEYMNMARAWAFGLDYNFISVRPVLLSLISAGFMLISSGEFLSRTMILLFSILSVLGTYYLGREMYNKKIGILAAFLMSALYLNLFFSFRLMVELPSLTCIIFSAAFFWRYIKKGDNRSLYLATIICALGTLFRITTVIVLLVALIVAFLTYRGRLFKRKEFWIAIILFLLILAPYIIWGYFQFDGFVILQAAQWNKSPGFSTGLSNLTFYLSNFPTYFSWPLVIIFIIGLFSFYKIILALDLIIKGKEKNLNRQIFLFLLFLLPILINSFSLGHPENRYILYSFPAIFLISSEALLKIFNKFKSQKVLVTILLIIFLAYFTHFQINSTDNLIQSKISSYGDIKTSGEWIGENIDPSSPVFTRSAPQVSYYSQGNILRLTEDKEEFLEQLKSIKDAYLMVSLFEPHEQWMFEYPSENNLLPVNVLFLDAQESRPSVIIYKLPN
jgi:4-amino-4-deoxy-L-arabinose transferase-like glycosyltransferase